MQSPIRSVGNNKNEIIMQKEKQEETHVFHFSWSSWLTAFALGRMDPFISSRNMAPVDQMIHLGCTVALVNFHTGNPLAK